MIEEALTFMLICLGMFFLLAGIGFFIASLKAEEGSE